jgi:hypothetical protein
METQEKQDSPFKVIKMDSGEDIICKVLKEFSDALIIQRPMSIAETNQFNEEVGEVVTHTGLKRWINFTLDTEFIIPKKRIMTMGNLAPDVSFYYKNLCKNLAQEEVEEPKTEKEAALKMVEMSDTLKDLMDRMDKDGDSNVLPFKPLDKSKLH